MLLGLPRLANLAAIGIARCKSRHFSTSHMLNITIKFNVTEDMYKEYEKNKKAQQEQKAISKKKKEKPPSKHTLENPLIMGKVSSERYEKVVKVAVPKHRLNETFLLFVRENDNILVYDEKMQCKPGDWILMRRQAEAFDVDVMHKVERVLYPYGNFVDPLTNRRSLGLYYDDDMERLETIKLDL